MEASQDIRLESGGEIVQNSKKKQVIESQSMDIMIKDNYRIEAKNMEEVADEVLVKASQKDLTLIAQQEVKTISSSKKIKLS